MTRTIHYDMDGKTLENVAGPFHFWPAPHGVLTPIRNEPKPSTPIGWVCGTCHLMLPTIEAFNKFNCHESEPCEDCGLAGLCATDCGGILGALSDPGVYIAGQHVDPSEVQ